MIKKVFFLLIGILFFSTGFSHTISKIDSLKIKLKSVHGEARFKILNVIADEYSNNDLVLAEKFALSALKLAFSLKNDKNIGLAYNSLANVYQYQSKLDLALENHVKALNFRKKAHDVVGIADSFNNIGIVYDQKANFKQAFQNYYKALQIYEKLHDSSKQAMVSTNIGIVFKAQNNIKKAYFYYKKAYDLYFRIHNEVGIVIASGNLGSIYINLKRYEASIKYSEKAKKGYLKLGFDRYLGYPILNIAVVNDSLRRYEIANLNYEKAIYLQQKNGNVYELADGAYLYANCLLKQNKIEKAIASALKALEASKKATAKMLEMQINNTLSKAYAKKGDYSKAYKYSILSRKTNDSLFEVSKTKAIYELEEKYQNEKKEKIIIQKDAESKKKSLWLIIISGLTLFTGIIGYLFFYQQKIKNLQQQQEFELQTAITKIQAQNELQEQRLSISRDLHDNIGSQLSFIISSVENLKFSLSGSNPAFMPKLSQISNFAKTTITELRDTIWAMNKSEITLEDLKNRLQIFINNAKLAYEHIDFIFEMDTNLSSCQLSSIQWVNIFRVIQEAINNAMKYSEASKIIVVVSKEKNNLQFLITDNGKGFELEKTVLGNGIYNMKKRVLDIDGEIHIESKLLAGTQIQIGLKME